MIDEEINKIIEVYDEVIIDLQQENSQLKEVIETLKNTNALLIKQNYQLEKDLDNESNKIEKTIEYIENVLQSFLYRIEYKELIEILKGDKD